MGCGQKMLKGHLTMLLTIPSKTINFFQCPAPPFKELNFSLTTDPQPLTSFTHDPEWRISVTVWRPQYRTGLVCSALVLGHHMLYVLSKLLYYIPIVCLLQKVEPLIIISIHCVLGCRGLGVRGPDPRPGVPAQQPAGELRREDEGHGGRHPQAGGAARTRQGQRGVLARPLDRSMEFRGSFHNFSEISLTDLHNK